MPNVNQGSLTTQLQTIINGLNVATQTKERLITLARSAQAINANSSTITTQLETLISTLPPSEALKEVALLIVSLALITDNRVLTVATLGDLPTTASAGSVYFVDSVGFPYIRRINGTWVLLENPQLGRNAYGWGSNFYGHLGDGTAVTRSSPVLVAGGFADWVQVTAGDAHTVGIRANGTAWAWGRNNYGQIGIGTYAGASRLSPVSVVGGFTDWVQVSANNNSTVAIRANGTAWGWGRNSPGNLGDNTSGGARTSPVSVVGGFTDWIQVAAGAAHSVGLRSNGTAWAWGANNNGQLGDNTTVSKLSPVSVVGGFTDWIQVSGGSTHTVALRSNGTAWSWGNGISGGLGDSTTVTKSSPVAVVGGFTDWIQVSGGTAHTVGIRANGTAWAWGSNANGRLGDGTLETSSKSSPVSIVGGFTDWVQVSGASAGARGLRANGTAWGWGSNVGGQLGDNAVGGTVSRSSPVSVLGGFTDWIQVSAGNNHTMALRS